MSPTACAVVAYATNAGSRSLPSKALKCAGILPTTLPPIAADPESELHFFAKTLLAEKL